MALSSRGSGSVALQPHRYELIVYCDDDTTPINLTIPRPSTSSSGQPIPVAEFKANLAAALQGKVTSPPRSSLGQDGPVSMKISIWDPVERRYVPFASSVNQLDAFGCRGQLWIEFQQPARLVAVASGTEDFAMLENCVEGIGNGYVSYQLIQAHRVLFPKLEKRFQAKKASIAQVGEGAPKNSGEQDSEGLTTLLFYMNNGAPCSAVLRGEGFLAGQEHQDALVTTTTNKSAAAGEKGISFSLNVCDPEQRTVSAQPMNVLLCEVAHGVIYEGPESGFRKDMHDTLLIRSRYFGGDIHVVFDPDQAIPRFVLTVKGQVGPNQAPLSSKPPVAAKKPAAGSAVMAPAVDWGKSPPPPTGWYHQHPSATPQVGSMSTAKSLDFSNASANIQAPIAQPASTTSYGSIGTLAPVPQRRVVQQFGVGDVAGAAAGRSGSVIGNLSVPAMQVQGVCDVHPGEARTLWCGNCDLLVCPYCLTVGTHRGHDARLLEDVVPKYRTRLLEAASSISADRDVDKREIEQLQNGRRRIQQHVQVTQQHLREAMQSLHQLLHAKEVELNHHLVQKINAVDEAIVVRRAHLADLVQQQQQLDEHARMPLDGPAQSRVRFLSLVPSLLAHLSTRVGGTAGGSAPSPMVPLATSLAPPEPAQTLQLQPLNVVKESIQALRLLSETSLQALTQMYDTTTIAATPSGGTVPNVPVPNPTGGLPPAGSKSSTHPSTEVEMSVLRQQLRDVQNGYVWVVPSATDHLNAAQTSDIFSDIFSLKGHQWEVRISPSEQDSVAIYLHPVEHQHRVDFRIVAIAPQHWHARQCKAWPESAKGLPWGVKPFIGRQQLLEHFVADGVLKLCVTPLGEPY